jgi:hypothetical protein
MLRPDFERTCDMQEPALQFALVLLLLLLLLLFRRILRCKDLLDILYRRSNRNTQQ